MLMLFLARMAIMSRRQLIAKDYARYEKHAASRFRVFSLFVRHKGFRALYIHRRIHHHLVNGKRVRTLWWFVIDRLFNRDVFIAPEAEIGPGLWLIHPKGVTIGVKATGEGCTIYQNATIGANYRQDDSGNELPVLGDKVVVGPGAVVVGPIFVGSKVVIGANAVITKDVPDECVVGGIPGKVIGKYDPQRFGCSALLGAEMLIEPLSVIGIL